MREQLHKSLTTVSAEVYIKKMIQNLFLECGIIQFKVYVVTDTKTCRFM